MINSKKTRSSGSKTFLKLVLTGALLFLFIYRVIPQPADQFHPERVIVKLHSQSELLKDLRDVLLQIVQKSSISSNELPVVILQVGKSGELLKNYHTITEFANQFPVQTVAPLIGLGFKNENSHGLDRVFILHFDAGNDIPGLVDLISKRNDVEYAEPDYIGGGDGRICETCGDIVMIEKGFFPPTDTLFNLQYALSNTGQIIGGAAGIPGADINIKDGWEITTGSPDIKIAFLDTGLPPEHPEFEGRLLPGYNFVSDTNNYADDHGHGTSVASIAAATGNKGYIAGTDWQAGIIPVKVLDNANTGFYSWWIQGINYAVNQGAHVLNLSLGGSSFSEVLLDAVNFAINNGVIVVACMMNENTDLTYYPAGYQGVISVGATNNLDQRAEPFAWGGGSNWGQHIDFVAPGNLIASLRHNNFYAGVYYSGTSMATPFVAGIISLMLSINPELTHNEIYDILKHTVRPQLTETKSVDPVWNEFTGWGRVDATAALNMTLAGGFPSYVNEQIGKGSKNPVKVFPNPAGEFLLISIREKVDRIDILDIQGKIVLSMEGNFSEDIIKLDISSFVQGIYILKAIGKEQIFNQKLIIKRNL